MSKCIAIVEDDESIRQNYRDALQRSGYQVQAFSERLEAHAAFKNRLPDLAILAITEKAAEMAPDVIQQLRERGELPLLVEIHDRFGTKRGPDFLTRYVQEAIGVKM